MAESDECVISLEQYMDRPEACTNMLFTSRDSLIIAKDLNLYKLDLQPQKMKYLQFKEEGYTLYATHQVNESEILTFHISSKWRINKYNFHTREKTELLEDICIYSVR